MAKKLLSVLLCSCMAAGMLVGCGSADVKESTQVSSEVKQESEVSTQAPSSEAVEEVVELEPVELKWWVVKSANSEDEDLVEAAVNEYLGGAMSVISVFFTVFMNILELLVAFIQAFVFTMLSSVFIGLAQPEHHNDKHSTR